MSESTREPAGEPAGTPADRLQPADWQTPPESLPAFMIIGRTRAGKTFRPSDWAERLCGVMAGFAATPGGTELALPEPFATEPVLALPAA